MANQETKSRATTRAVMLGMTALCLVTLAAAAAPTASAWEPTLPARVCTPGIDTEGINPDPTPTPIRVCLYPDIID
jgi:hypothetical protein